MALSPSFRFATVQARWFTANDNGVVVSATHHKRSKMPSPRAKSQEHLVYVSLLRPLAHALTDAVAKLAKQIQRIGWAGTRFRVVLHAKLRLRVMRDAGAGIII